MENNHKITNCLTIHYYWYTIHSSYNKQHIIYTYRRHIASIPIPYRLSYTYSFGSLLGTIIVIQVIVGILLSFIFTTDTVTLYELWLGTLRDHYRILLLRLMHVTIANILFIAVYVHIIRNYHYSSIRCSLVYVVGYTIYLLLIAAAFTGYALP